MDKGYSVENQGATGRQQLRIAHLSPTFFDDKSVIGGGERYVYNLARSLAAISSRPSPRFSQTIFALGADDKLSVIEGIPVRILPNENSSHNLMSGTSGRFWQELVSFDLVHVHQSLTEFGVYSTTVAKSLGKTLVLTDLGGGHSSLMLSGRGLELADGVISISRYAHSLIGASFSGPHEIIMGPIDTDLFAPSSRRPPEKRSVICVSRILPHKGIDRLLTALPQGLSLRIVGRVYNETYYGMLRQMSAGKDVTFVHDADDEMLLELYRSSGLFVQASTAKDCYGNIVQKPELMGLTTLEAMSCGLPAIVSRAGSLPELVPDKDFGLVFSDHNELVRQLEAFKAGAWPPTGAADRARRYVVDNYSLPVVGAKLANFYTAVHDQASQTGRECAF